MRGLRAFAETMTAAWTDEARAVEGRPVAQEEAVALFTMRAAKGLEWPIVIPVNTMTGVMSPDSAVIDRHTDTFYCPVLGVAPDGYDAARQAEKDELGRERIRLWYVAATRARDLFVLPRLDTTPSKSAWIGPLDLSLADLPGLDVSHLPLGAAAAGAGASNAQTRAAFATEAAAIAARQTRLLWLAPCRDESASGAVLQEGEAGIWLGGMPADVLSSYPSRRRLYRLSTLHAKGLLSPRSARLGKLGWNALTVQQLQTSSRDTLMHDFKIGDHVSWNSEAGRVSGTIVRVHTSDFKVKGYTHHASTEAPQYEIKSSKTEHIAFHKGSALSKLGD